MKKEIQLLADLIALTDSKDSDLSLYQNLYQKIRQAIMAGSLSSGVQLPSSRALASSLNISRNTVISAYDQLISEGFLLAEQGSGTYVNDLNLLKPQKHVELAATRVSQPVPISSRLKNITETPKLNFSSYGGRLLPGLVEQKFFPYRQWNKLYKHNSENVNAVLSQLEMSNGYMPLCNAICRHVAVTRGINAEPSQIFITAGASQSISLISRVLADPGDIAWMEEPGYLTVAESLVYENLKLELMPVDHEGLCLVNKQQMKSNPRLIYATTSYQFPLGFTMSIKRRLDLIDMARKKQAWIIEDDYDGEFRYKGKPIPSLFSLENNNRTIYMGTFSKALSPALRMSFIVVPQQLVSSFQYVYPAFGNVSSMVTQATLADFISSGSFARHITQMRKLYSTRRAAMELALQKAFGETLQGNLNPGGLHITLKLIGTEANAIENAVAVKIGCLPLSIFYRSKQETEHGFLLGFTSSGSAIIEESVEILEKILMKHNQALVYPE